MADLRLHLKLETAYAQCESFLTGGVRKDQKLIGRCTSLRRESANGETVRFVIHYHATDIVFVYRDRVTLDSSIIANLAIERGGFLKNIGLPTLWDKSLDAETRARMLAREGAWIKRDAKKLICKSLQRQLGLEV